MAASESRKLLAPLAAWLLLAPFSVALAAQDVEDWAPGELADYVYEKLTTAPRFAASSVHLVVFADGQPAFRSDELSLALRDALRQSLAGRDGIQLGWQPDPAAPLQQLPSTAAQCEAMQPDLLVGVEVEVAGDAAATVIVRALDDVERRWVPGFGREWRGRLTAAQQRAHASAAVDRAYLGRRDVPYDVADTDLIASHLARDLRCQLMRQVSGVYRLAAADAQDDEALAAVPSLVRHQVGGVSSLELLAAADAANARLDGALHAVAGDLHQYWLVLEPVDNTEGLQPLVSSVYVAVDANRAAPDRGGDEPLMPAPMAGVLRDMRLVRLAGTPGCPRAASSFYGQSGERCAALRVTAGSDAVVFFLNHQRNLGLVRLGDARCEPRPRAHVLRRGESLTVRVPDLVAVDGAEWSAVASWSMAPAAEVYLAIASADSDAARAIAKHVATLPARCSDSVRPGLDGAALEHWLRGLRTELERRGSDVEWRGVQARSVL